MSSRFEIYASGKNKSPFPPLSFYALLVFNCFSQLHNYNSVIHLVA